MVSCAKLLGCTLSYDCKRHLHIDSVVSRSSQRLHLLTILKKAGVGKEQLVQFYEAKIRSILAYAFPAMANMGVKNLARLEVVERRAVRIIGSSPKTPLLQFLEHSCQKLVIAASSDQHRLNSLFLRNARKNTLTALHLQKLLATETLL